ncbi:MAG: hypothetical protein ACD_61C00271G0002 [uncultured bacterium]|nr:MAG: hypothetical protein ACD_61C00271G0002 [uncultured bacterium]KKT49690.1 MAG: hypothetical protein UW41_C0003G0057 [Candidatus Collierbacteria bacterium GW2011_GWC2_44_18]
MEQDIESKYVSPEERELTEKKISFDIQMAYKKTPEYEKIQKLLLSNPNRNENQIIELIKSSRKKISEMPHLYDGSSSTMTMTNRKYLVDDYNKYLYLMEKWKETQTEIEKPFFDQNELLTTGKLMLYHWALKSNLPQIMMQGLLPAALSGEGSGSGILNYGTLDLNNNWVSAGIGGLDVESPANIYALLQVDIGGSELVSWTYFSKKDGGLSGGWNSSLFSSTALNPNGVEKMFHRFIRADKDALRANSMPSILPEYQEDQYRYSYMFKSYLPGGFFNSSEEEEMMFWYAAPRRIRIVERKRIDPKELDKYFRAKRSWRKQVTEYRKSHPELDTNK